MHAKFDDPPEAPQHPAPCLQLLLQNQAGCCLCLAPGCLHLCCNRLHPACRVIFPNRELSSCCRCGGQLPLPYAWLPSPVVQLPAANIIALKFPGRRSMLGRRGFFPTETLQDLAFVRLAFRQERQKEMHVCQILMGHLLLVPQGQPGFQIRRSCQQVLIKQALCALQPPAKPQTLLNAAQSTSTPHQRAYHIQREFRV